MPEWLEAQISAARKLRYNHVKEDECLKQVEMKEALLKELEESGM